MINNDNFINPEPISEEDFISHFSENMKNSENLNSYIPGNLDNIPNPNLLHESYKKCKKSVSWKQSVQRFGVNELKNNIQLHNQIENDDYQQDPIHEFKLNERGHIRDIKSHTIRDRVVEKSVNDNILLPRLQPLLIYDNGASLEGKGVSFTRSRFELHLRKAYEEYGPGACVLLMDFSKFFDNINHNIILSQIRPYLNDYEFDFLKIIFKNFEIDVSYMSDEEFDICLSVMFNSLEYSETVDKTRLNHTKMMAKSMGIGSQTSQISGIFFPHDIDNYCKIIKGDKYYDRYMDDTGIIFKSKEEAFQRYYEIEEICNRLGIFINHKKTQIIPIIACIPFLKINYYLTDTGGLIKKVNSETFRRERRKIIKFTHLLSKNIITLNEVINCYKSWRGTYSKFDSGYEIFKIDKFVIESLGLDPNIKFY